MTRKNFRRSAGICMCILLLSGMCGGCTGSSTENSTENIESAVISEEKHEPITISLFNNLLTEEFLQAVEDKYPEINLEVVPYSGANGSGYARYSFLNDDMTDIYVSTKFYYRDMQSERLVDLSEYDYLNEYNTSLLDSVEVDGSVYLLPSGYGISGIQYNKTLMEENGWEVPQSFEELTELIPEIEAAGYNAFKNCNDLPGYVFSYFFGIANTVWMSTPEGVKWKNDFVAGKQTAVGQEGLMQSAEYFQKWIDSGIITSEHTSNTNYMSCGDTVFMLNLGLSKFEYTDDNGKTYEFGTMPWLSEDGSNNMLVRDVGRYMGINKHLEEDGNEQKLADALHVMELFSSAEGQQLLLGNSSLYVSPINGEEITEDSPYYDVTDVIDSGRVIQQVYVGWEDIIIPISEYMAKMVTGEITAEELVEGFDAAYEAINVAGTDAYAVAAEEIPHEIVQKMIAIAECEATDADCALLSEIEYHGGVYVNKAAGGYKIYAGDITDEVVNLIRPVGTDICVLEMTGAKIKQLQQNGLNYDDSEAYTYLLFTKNGIELNDDETYKLAVAYGELDSEYLDISEKSGATLYDAMVAYISGLGTFTADDIAWK